jgi:flagellar hook-associated protein 2
MSTSSVSSSSSSSTGYLLSSLGTGTAMQITGLASGLNTNQIIQEEMSIYSQPVTNLQNQQSGLTAQNTALSSVQSELQTLVSDAMALGDPSLFDTTQAVTSSDPTRVTATSSTGAGVGG